MTESLYQAHYCEENIWHLAQAAKVETAKAHVVVVSNSAKCCAMWHQKASPNPEQPVLWDYHVILFEDGENRQIWDLDSTLGAPISPSSYIAQTWEHLSTVPDAFRPRFRLIEASEYIAQLSSDRSHMLVSEGNYKEAPPEWPAILAGGEDSNLHRFINMDLPFLGRVLSYEEFAAEVG